MKKLIIVEGIEGCGKTTLINGLYDNFIKDGKTVLKITNPINDVYAEEIKKILESDRNDKNLESLAYLFSVDKLQALNNDGILMTADEDVIIMDRFIDSYSVYNKKYVNDILYRTVCNYVKTRLIDTGRYIYHVYLRISNIEVTLERLKFRNGDKEIFDDALIQDNHSDYYDKIFQKRLCNIDGEDCPWYINIFKIIESYNKHGIMIYPMSTKETCIIVDAERSISDVVHNVTEMIGKHELTVMF